MSSIHSKDLPDSNSEDSENSDYEFAVVIPCLNESRTIADCIEKASSFFNSRGIKAQILVADNNSTDNSRDIAESRGAQVVRVAEKGYGHALHGGILATKAKYIIMGDADGSYDFSQLDSFVSLLRERADLVMGNRFLGGIEDGAMPVLHRVIGNPFFSWLGRFLFKTNIGDINCGLRGFSREAYHQMNICSRGMEFAVEMVIKMSLFDKVVKEVPIKLHRDGRDRPPHLRTWRDGWRTLRFMLMLSPHWIFQIPALTLLSIGSLVTLLLYRGPISIGRANFDIHSLLIVSMTIPLGVQILSSGILVRIFAESRGLLPKSHSKYSSWKGINFEQSLMVSALVFLIGVLIVIEPTLGWINSKFSALDPSQVMRQLIPGIICLILSVQIFFTSFAASILRLSISSDKVSVE